MIEFLWLAGSSIAGLWNFVYMMQAIQGNAAMYFSLEDTRIAVPLKLVSGISDPQNVINRDTYVWGGGVAFTGVLMEIWPSKEL